MLKQYEHIMIAKELGTFHAVEKMYYRHIALYLLESDIDKNYNLIVDENLTVLQKNVKTFADFELDFDSPISENLDESAFDVLEKDIAFLNVHCMNNVISYDKLTERVNDAISDIACEIHDLSALGVLSDLQVYFLNAILQYIINEAYINIESPYAEQCEESENENY